MPLRRPRVRCVGDQAQPGARTSSRRRPAGRSDRSSAWFPSPRRRGTGGLSRGRRVRSRPADRVGRAPGRRSPAFSRGCRLRDDRRPDRRQDRREDRRRSAGRRTPSSGDDTGAATRSPRAIASIRRSPVAASVNITPSCLVGRRHQAGAVQRQPTDAAGGEFPGGHRRPGRAMPTMTTCASPSGWRRSGRVSRSPAGNSRISPALSSSARSDLPSPRGPHRRGRQAGRTWRECRRARPPLGQHPDQPAEARVSPWQATPIGPRSDITISRPAPA